MKHWARFFFVYVCVYVFLFGIFPYFPLYLSYAILVYILFWGISMLTFQYIFFNITYMAAGSSPQGE